MSEPIISLEGLPTDTNRQRVRKTFVEKTGGMWVPSRGSAVTLAAKGLDSQVHEDIVWSKTPTDSIKRHLRLAAEYQRIATIEANNLRNAVDYDFVLMPVDELFIRNSLSVQGSIARYLLFMDCFEKDVWPKQKPQSAFDKKLEPYQQEVAQMPSLLLIDTWQNALFSATNEDKFWLEQRRFALRDPKIVEIVGSTAVKFAQAT